MVDILPIHLRTWSVNDIFSLYSEFWVGSRRTLSRYTRPSPPTIHSLKRLLVYCIRKIRYTGRKRREDSLSDDNPWFHFITDLVSVQWLLTWRPNTSLPARARGAFGEHRKVEKTRTGTRIKTRPDRGRSQPKRQREHTRDRRECGEGVKLR